MKRTFFLFSIIAFIFTGCAGPQSIVRTDDFAAAALEMTRGPQTMRAVFDDPTKIESASYYAMRYCDPLGEAGERYHKLGSLRAQVLKRSYQYRRNAAGYERLVRYTVLFDIMQNQLASHCNLPRQVCVFPAAKDVRQICGPPGDPDVLAASKEDHLGIRGRLYIGDFVSVQLARPTYAPPTRCDMEYMGRSFDQSQKRGQCVWKLDKEYRRLIPPPTTGDILDLIWEVNSKVSDLKRRMYTHGGMSREVVYGPPRKRRSNDELESN